MDITSAINGGMTINQVRRGTDLAAVTAQVLARYASNDSPRSIPAGPLDDLYPEQRMVLVCEDVNARTKEKLFVFLYGIWAEKFQFIKVTNCIQVWGGENIVFDYEPEAPKVLSCCICISDRIERDDKGVEIDTIDTKVTFYRVSWYLKSVLNIMDTAACSILRSRPQGLLFAYFSYYRRCRGATSASDEYIWVQEKEV